MVRFNDLMTLMASADISWQLTVLRLKFLPEYLPNWSGCWDLAIFWFVSKSNTQNLGGQVLTIKLDGVNFLLQNHQPKLTNWVWERLYQMLSCSQDALLQSSSPVDQLRQSCQVFLMLECFVSTIFSPAQYMIANVLYIWRMNACKNKLAKLIDALLSFWSVWNCLI